ncbi:MAG: hypothetical protein MI919_11510 [Holophagales bacterium]|nr:hypothetical protein [Holophagales bacterium]
MSVRGPEIVPTERLSLLRSGRLSAKAMPQRRALQIYQDHVCSVCLGVAAEMFALLPLEWVVATATDTLLDTSTGHLQEQAILSVAIPRGSLRRLRLERLDASDSLKNFLHRMRFTQSNGFSPVEALGIGDLPS